MAPTLEERIETRGPDIFAALVPQFKSLHLISEIQADRLKHPELGDMWFHCGDGVAYGLDGKDVILYLTDFANNPLTKDLERASQELIKNHNFFVDKSTASGLKAKASASNGVVAFNLSELHLQKESSESGCIVVSTLNLAQGKLVFKIEYGDKVVALFDRVHGDAIYGSNGIGGLLHSQDIDFTRIYMLNEEYVRQVLTSKEEGTMLARASFIGRLRFNGGVDLSGQYFTNHLHARGVVKEVAEGGAPKVEICPVEQAYDALLNPANRNRALDLTNPVRAAGLLGLVTAYLNQQKQ